MTVFDILSVSVGTSLRIVRHSQFLEIESMYAMFLIVFRYHVHASPLFSGLIVETGDLVVGTRFYNRSEIILSFLAQLSIQYIKYRITLSSKCSRSR